MITQSLGRVSLLNSTPFEYLVLATLAFNGFEKKKNYNCTQSKDYINLVFYPTKIHKMKKGLKPNPSIYFYWSLV